MLRHQSNHCATHSIYIINLINISIFSMRFSWNSLITHYAMSPVESLCDTFPRTKNEWSGISSILTGQTMDVLKMFMAFLVCYYFILLSRGSFHKAILATVDLSYLLLILRLPALIFKRKLRSFRRTGCQS